MPDPVGLVVPAYRPDLDRLERYVGELCDAVEGAVVRIELDAPGPDATRFADRVDADVAVAPVRRGKGLAITAGFEALEAEVLAFVDADGATDAASVARLVEAVRDGDADLAVGSRRHPDAVVATAQSRSRRVLSDGFARFARVATGIQLSDFQCGAKAISRSCWRDVRDGVYESGFGWDLEVLWLAASRGCTIDEVPVEWRDRPGSTVAPVWTTLGLATLLVRIATARAAGCSHALPGRRRAIERLAEVGG
ncbi:MAG: glycosyltransferase [Halobacteriales archaeon]